MIGDNGGMSSLGLRDSTKSAETFAEDAFSYNKLPYKKQIIFRLSSNLLHQDLDISQTALLD